MRSAGADGETTEPLEDFLADRSERLVLDVSFERPAASAFAALEYPHTHEYTVLAVTGARAADGDDEPRGDRPRRDGRPPALGRGARRRIPRRPARPRSGTSRFADDALASAWYREQTLPVLVRRVLTQLEESA